MANAKTVAPSTATQNVKLSASEFKRIASLVYELTGIHLPEQKLTLLSNRLRKRVRALCLDGFEAYYQLLRDRVHCEKELPEFLSAVTTNETYFFRNERLWNAFRKTWLPDTVKAKTSAGSKSIRVWSAASSSGEEAYTAAMCVAEDLPNFRAWKVQVVGTDISKNMLDRAKAGVYTDYAVAQMPKPLRDKWFDHQERGYLLDPKIRCMVKFEFHNLRDPMPDARFDLIFLRNVLMYFDLPMKQRVLTNVADALVPGGHLVIGDVDPVRTTPALSERLGMTPMAPNWYHKPTAESTAP